jgi:hypothetical protein
VPRSCRFRATSERRTTPHRAGRSCHFGTSFGCGRVCAPRRTEHSPAGHGPTPRRREVCPCDTLKLGLRARAPRDRGGGAPKAGLVRAGLCRPKAGSDRLAEGRSLSRVECRRADIRPVTRANDSAGPAVRPWGCQPITRPHQTKEDPDVHQHPHRDGTRSTRRPRARLDLDRRSGDGHDRAARRHRDLRPGFDRGQRRDADRAERDRAAPDRDGPESRLPGHSLSLGRQPLGRPAGRRVALRLRRPRYGREELPHRNLEQSAGDDVPRHAGRLLLRRHELLPVRDVGRRRRPGSRARPARRHGRAEPERLVQVPIPPTERENDELREPAAVTRLARSCASSGSASGPVGPGTWSRARSSRRGGQSARPAGRTRAGRSSSPRRS